jgi:hypothetical protein
MVLALGLEFQASGVLVVVKVGEDGAVGVDDPGGGGELCSAAAGVVQAAAGTPSPSPSAPVPTKQLQTNQTSKKRGGQQKS